MKTKWTAISLVLAVMFVATSVFAQQDGPRRGVDPQDRPAPTVQDDPLERPFTPEERAVIRQFLRNRLEQMQSVARQRAETPPAAGRRQDFAPQQRDQFARRPFMERPEGLGSQRFAGRDSQLDRELGQQQRRFAPERFGADQAPMRPPFSGQGRMERPFAGRFAGQCPCCRRPIIQQTPPRRQGRPVDPPLFEGRQGGPGRGDGFGPQRFERRGDGWRDEDPAARPRLGRNAP